MGYVWTTKWFFHRSYSISRMIIWRFPKIRGPFLGAPNKDHSILGSLSGGPVSIVP